MKLAGLVLAALGINLALFLLMDNMVSRDRVRVVDLVDAQAIEFIRTPIDEETRTKDRRRPPPPKPQEIERPRAQVDDIAQRASSLPADVASFEVTSLLASGAGVALGQTLVEGGPSNLNIMMAEDLIPLTMLPPQYPTSARVRNIEGWVDMLFTVTAEGTVIDPQVVDAEPPNIFDRAAQDALLRWRFRPVVENGEPVPVLVQIRINFNFQD